MLELNKIYHGDCLELMPKIADKSIDMILADLPYGSTACKWDTIIPFNKYVQIGKKVIYEQEYVFDKMKSGVSYKEALEDFLSISKDGLWDSYNRVIKDRGAIVLFGSEPFSSYLRMSNIKQYKYDWVWDKKKGGNIMNLKQQPYKVHEIISVFAGGNYYPIMTEQKPRTGKTYSAGEANGIENYGDLRHYDKKFPKSILEVSNANQKGKVHPTQKPVALFEYLIKTYTNKGELVLDNCMGSGTTAIACIRTGRDYIGFEINEKWHKIACDRVNGITAGGQISIFGRKE